MVSSWAIYDALILEAEQKLALHPGFSVRVSNLVMGLNWTVVELDFSGAKSLGLCFSPPKPGRTLPWSGTLVGREAAGLVHWIKHWEPASAVVGCAVINAVINHNCELLSCAEPVHADGPPNINVFDHFRPRLKGANVAVVGNYPNLQPFAECGSWVTLERNPAEGDLPDPACAYILPESDWVFITASSLSNKTLPMLLQHAQSATVVLLGPSLPWSNHWASSGIDYLAGVEITDPDLCFRVAGEAGGTRLFDVGCTYKVHTLHTK